MNEWDFLDGFSPFLQQSSPLVSVPSQLIRVGTLGNLGNDGHLFTVQSSGNEIVITLTAPPTSYYGALPWVLKHKPQILANSIPLDSARVVATNCVGQKVVFQLAFDPSLPDGVLVTNQNQWFLPPKYVNAYEWFQPSMPALNNSDGNYYVTMCHPELTIPTIPGYGIDLPACTKYQQQDWPLSQPETGVWWLSDGDKMISCYPTLSFANGQKGSLTVRGQLTIRRPQVAFDTASATIGPVKVWPTGDTIPDAELTSGGVGFDAVVTSDFPGQANWVQLINRQLSGDGFEALFLLQHNTYGGYWLDNDPFYNTQNGDPGTPPVHAPVTAGKRSIVPFGTAGKGDAPSIGILSTSFISMTDSFKTYLVFNPDPNDANNIWVTLGQVTWGWSGYAAFDIPTIKWVLITGTTNAPGYTDSDAFPSWTRVYSNSQ
jgi:hypothetical protein